MRIEVERERDNRERGNVLLVLKEDYRREMTSVRNLLGTLDALGISLSEEDLAFHLIYLSDQGYLRVLRAKDMPNYRRDRRLPGWEKPETIQFIKLFPKGLQLIDGVIPEDPHVRF
jgi:hypothetical protein